MKTIKIGKTLSIRKLHIVEVSKNDRNEILDLLSDLDNTIDRDVFGYTWLDSLEYLVSEYNETINTTVSTRHAVTVEYKSQIGSNKIILFANVSNRTWKKFMEKVQVITVIKSVK